MKIDRTTKRFVPTIVAVSVVAGIIIGTFFANRFSGNRLNIINTSSNKLNDLMHIIDDQYVDTVNIAELVENAMPTILSELDPHSSYISAKNAETNNDDLKGSFSGVGIQFVIRDDTLHINGVIKGGPSEKVGILPGDRIVQIDGKPFVGKEATNEEAMHRLKGKKGSEVKLGIKRRGHKELLSFVVERGDIPVSTINSYYMLNKDLGYIKIEKFGETTYAELLTALANLEAESFKGLVIDLRGNGGGYMQAAIQMINEFLPENRLIVYTEGRKMKREDFLSDGRGSYQDIPLVVLIDELSASASEIFSGAMQDNDRACIVGRRSFGKGLVQQPIAFSDGSLIHLTIARYYTPSGRCIQKPYKKGDKEDYEMELINRYTNGEIYNEDSIKQNGQAYKTRIGRTVYGGGGIMPDYFVSEDTTLMTPYYREVMSKGLGSEFCFNYADDNRDKLTELGNIDKIVKYLKNDGVIEKFVKFADSRDVVRRNNMIYKSQPLFEKYLYGSIIYNVLEMNDYVQYLNRDDVTLAKAVELFNNKQTFPTLPKSALLDKKYWIRTGPNTTPYYIQNRLAIDGQKRIKKIYYFA